MVDEDIDFIQVIKQARKLVIYHEITFKYSGVDFHLRRDSWADDCQFSLFEGDRSHYVKIKFDRWDEFTCNTIGKALNMLIINRIHCS